MIDDAHARPMWRWWLDQKVCARIGHATPVLRQVPITRFDVTQRNAAGMPEAAVAVRTTARLVICQRCHRHLGD